jgi:ABC-type antimicrobial peptide transport system permease subunit
MVLFRALRLTLTGVTIGTGAALALSRVLVSQLQPSVSLNPVFGMHEAGGLYEVSATDPVTFIAIAALLTAVAMLACFLPARRATRVDPMMALQAE